jgi:hypothetical protein
MIPVYIFWIHRRISRRIVMHFAPNVAYKDARKDICYYQAAVMSDQIVEFRESLIAYLAKIVVFAQLLSNPPTVDAIVQVELPFVLETVCATAGMPRLGDVRAFLPNPAAALRGLCTRLEHNGHEDGAIRCVRSLDVSDSIFQHVVTHIPCTSEECLARCLTKRIDAERTVRPLLKAILE